MAPVKLFQHRTPPSGKVQSRYGILRTEYIAPLRIHGVSGQEQPPQFGKFPQWRRQASRFEAAMVYSSNIGAPRYRKFDWRLAKTTG